MFTSTVFEILLVKGRLVLSPTQWSTGSKRVNDLPDDVFFNIAINVDDTTLYSKCAQICGNNKSCELESSELLNLNLIYETLLTGVGSDLLISMLQKLNWFRLPDLITLVLLI